jgi:hypothetical protein
MSRALLAPTPYRSVAWLPVMVQPLTPKPSPCATLAIRFRIPIAQVGAPADRAVAKPPAALGAIVTSTHRGSGLAMTAAVRDVKGQAPLRRRVLPRHERIGRAADHVPD